jgi:hypothetical protein
MPHSRGMPSAKSKSDAYEVPAELQDFFDAFVDLLVAAYMKDHATGDAHGIKSNDEQQRHLPADQ